MQKKIIMLVIHSILITALVVTAIAFTNYGRIVEDNSQQIMQLMCSEKSHAIDEKLLNIEQSVHTIYHYAVDQIKETQRYWNYEEKFQQHVNKVKALMETTAKYTDGAVSVYYRVSPDKQNTVQGCWLVQNRYGNFIENESTDISLYEKDDIEHVGWYYIPIENGKETWMNPYFNKNLDVEMISYVIPIFIDDEVFGVIGMDIDTRLLYDNTKALTVYDRGYAFLMDSEGQFLYHPEMQGQTVTKEFDEQHAYLYEKSLLSTKEHSVEEYQWNGVDKYLTSQKLRNGMIFTVCVEKQEVDEPKQTMLMNSIVVIAIIMSIFVMITVSLTRAIISLMYTDTMARVANKAAYTEYVDKIYKKFRAKEHIDFTVVVVDINDLKKVNDTYGHEYGDRLIQNGASILKKVWGKRSVFRIGGDEFAVLLFDIDTKFVDEKKRLFDEEIKNFNEKNNEEALYLQMAIGIAVYDPEKDQDYMEVFRRADEEMYIDKKEKKDKKKRLEETI